VSKALETKHLTLARKYAPKSETVLLFGGLTPTRERLLQAAAASLGESYIYLPNIDYKSFELGKIYGNKAQCNPTYFTVGNLIKYLFYLRDEMGLSTDEIIRKYVHVTVNGCGPCRFGMYITEYKKALRDAGFEGFRVVSFEHDSNIFQVAQEQVVTFSPKFFLILIKTTLIADILTILGDKLRPYELKKGSVDKALKECEDLIIKTLESKKSLLLSLVKCRKILAKVELNKLQPKPKVMVMGEFWAAMTRSDGNYHIHQFLEDEGAEVISQPLINRILLNVWEAEYKRELVQDVNKKDGIDFSTTKSKFLIFTAKHGIRFSFNLYAKAIGLANYHLANMDHLYKISKDYYPVDSNGGEGQLEVAHLLENLEKKEANLVVSIKPFGCMPSSGVSDGIQSLITAKFKNARFISIETSGDGATNFYSRLQMALFKAKEEATEEFNSIYNNKIESKLKSDKALFYKINSYNFEPKSKLTTTAGKIVDYIRAKL
jgi:predicted nucleotide-binding protein (sugar kinase/HSP70/actin superfamily)